MSEFSLSTHLAAPPDLVWAHLLTPALLQYVAKGVLQFEPIDPPEFPDRWAEGEYKVRMIWKGFLPVGEQIIGIELPPQTGAARIVRDRGRSALIRVWDHEIEIAPEGEGTRYTDRMRLEAGALTAPLTLFAKRFYAHRQKRWRRLVANDFDYAA